MQAGPRGSWVVGVVLGGSSPWESPGADIWPPRPSETPDTDHSPSESPREDHTPQPGQHFPAPVEYLGPQEGMVRGKALGAVRGRASPLEWSLEEGSW